VTPLNPGAVVPITSPGMVVIACSAGGLPELRAILSSLDPDFPAAIAIVQHRGDQYPELLPELLQRRTRLRVCDAREGDLLEAGTVYICPAGMHMTAEHSLHLVSGPRIEYVRPSADLMFQSVASSYGGRAIGVVLSGAGSDAAVGCGLIARAGGLVVVQEPSSCIHAGMPSAAIAGGHVDLVLPVAEIAARLRALADAARGGMRVPLKRARGTRVILADDHRIVLEGLRMLLTSEADIQVLAQAEDGRTAVHLSAELCPDVVVMDIAMPDLDGIAATRQIKAHDPQIAVVALSARTDERTAMRIVRAGATGYVSKGEAFDELALAIRSVAACRPYFSPRIAPLIAMAAAAKPGRFPDVGYTTLSRTRV
jgi:two-component system, chemotaxis family, protein-glutamate methylesterase/glutaminase